MKMQEPEREEGGGKKAKPKGVHLIHELSSTHSDRPN